MTNLRTFIVKYLGYTNKKPARISITDLRHKKTKIINDDTYEGRDINERASMYLKERGIEVCNQSEGRGYGMLHTNDFATQIKD